MNSWKCSKYFFVSLFSGVVLAKIAILIAMVWYELYWKVCKIHLKYVKDEKATFFYFWAWKYKRSKYWRSKKVGWWPKLEKCRTIHITCAITTTDSFQNHELFPMKTDCGSNNTFQLPFSYCVRSLLSATFWRYPSKVWTERPAKAFL